MAITDEQVTASGDRKIIHNGVVLHVGRKVQLDTTKAPTIALLAAGYIAAVTTATVYDDGIAPLQQYTVQTVGNTKLQHNGATKATNDLVFLDPLEPQTISLVARGLIA
jgi:hypothetical protein